MEQAFIAILKKLISEQGKEVLLSSAKCKAFLADYTRGEYKKESRLLLQAIEAGVSKEIDNTDELDICKQQQVRVLQEEYFLKTETAADVVDTLSFVLKEDSVKVKAETPKTEAAFLPLPSHTSAKETISPPIKEPFKKKHTKRNVLIAIVGLVFLYLFYINVQKSNSNSTQSITPAAIPEVVYKIGDTGPAGGIIFYDKGYISDGWRYLEAAPVETDKIPFDFSLDLSFAEISDRGMGAGLENTRLYLEKLRALKISGNTAPWICDTLVLNGYNDWYLPSLDELLIMYNNLRNIKATGFHSRNYWSSTCYPRGSDSPGAAYFVNFSNGEASWIFLGEPTRVRACRRFSESGKTFSERKIEQEAVAQAPRDQEAEEALKRKQEATAEVNKREQEAQSYYHLGNTNYNAKNYDQAISNYTEAIRILPNFANAYYWRGLSYFQKKDYDSAISNHTEAIRINPNDAVAYYWRSEAYYDKNEFDRVIADCTQAIHINPKYANAYFGRGNAYVNKKDYNMAITDYNEAIRIDPSYANAYCSRGVAYEYMGNYSRARADYEEALRINPNLTAARDNLHNIKDR
jgi:tetratricopeptide (TPR) repeat protein